MVHLGTWLAVGRAAGLHPLLPGWDHITGNSVPGKRRLLSDEVLGCKLSLYNFMLRRDFIFW